MKLKRLSGLLLLMLVLIVAACTPKATKYYKKAMAHYEQAEFQPAIENFQQAQGKGYAGADANYYIAESYRRSNRMHEAEPYYAKAVQGNIGEEDAYFWYAYAMKANGNYEGAKKQFEEYQKVGTNFDFINRAKNEIENLKVLNEIVAKKSYYEIKNIDQLNTEHAEYSPMFYGDKLYFTTARGAEKMHQATGTGFTDIYEYIFDGMDYFTGQARPLPEVINTPDAHEATPVFSKDGQTMYFSRGNNGERKGQQDVDIFMSKRGKDGMWSEPEKLPISDDNAWDSSPALSPDGKTLYFASNRESSDAKGGVDLYKATLDKDGKWGNVTNLGTPINTRGNDMFPYITQDGTFYFSSDGHPSLGSLDLFTVKKDGGKMKVENLGKPINSSYDDFGITYKDTITGFFASNRPGGKGDDDVYEFIDRSKVKIVHYVLDGTAFGTSKDQKNYPLDSVLVKLVSDKGDTIAVMWSDVKGKFTAEIEPEKKYKVIPKKSEYMMADMHAQYLDFSTIGTKVPMEKLEPGETTIKIPFNFTLTKIEKDIILVVDNIYYDFNKWDIRPDAALVLDTIVMFLKEYPEIKVELGAHTDERGSADYNRKLSQKRAESAVKYIISKGIASDRITAKGYGEDRPRYKNANTEELHQANRRTEFKITNVAGKIKVQNKGTNSDLIIEHGPGENQNNGQ